MKTRLSNRALSLIENTKPEQTYLRALLIFAAQNPGFEWGNYVTGDYKASLAAYRGDSRPVQKQMRDIKGMRFGFYRLSNDIMRRASSVFSGRLQFRETPQGVAVDYCTGQYWPTEFRLAALTVLREAFDIARAEETRQAA